ncbi:abhydrolase domain containing 13-like protein Bem46 [Arctopsyche grandis]|uniref:abhydrolase domain containing 13-like protein Bem46 n=1 Tax=Arctopsyche grandis TaxID=121162 RepID=UPI00406D8BC4
MTTGDLKFFHVLVMITHRLWRVAILISLICILMYVFYSGIAACVLLLVSLSLSLYYAEDQLVYHPTLPTHSRVFVPRPSGYNLPFESVRCPSKDGTVLHMFFIRQPINGDTTPTLVFFHGNAGNMGHRLQNTAGLYHNLCVNILMVEYRGYGLSDGSPSESGLCMDARTAVDYLLTRTDIDVNHIIIFGRSLGGAVAIDLVSRQEYANKIWCMIVENTFTSIPEMAKHLLGWRILNVVPHLFYKNKFMSIKKVRHIGVPSLFICGQADGFVPPIMGESLYAYCNATHKKLARVAGGGHNDTWTCRGYHDILKTFLQETPPRNKLPITTSIHHV